MLNCVAKRIPQRRNPLATKALILALFSCDAPFSYMETAHCIHSLPSTSIHPGNEDIYQRWDIIRSATQHEARNALYVPFPRHSHSYMKWTYTTPI